MGDDWDEPSTSTSVAPAMGGVFEGGTKFSAGRGFKPAAASSNDDGWGDSSADAWVGGSSAGGDSGDFRGRKRDENGFGERRGGRGGGRGGSRGGRGGGRSFDNDRGNRGEGRGNWHDNNGESKDDWGGGKKDDDAWGGGNSDSWGDSRGDRGNRGGRGDRGDRGGDRGDRGGDRGDRGGDRGNRRRENGESGGDWKKDEGKDGEPEKKREIYVPVERVADDDLFSSGIATGINFMKLDEIEVKVSGENPPPPITSFEKSGLRPHLLENVTKSGYTKPTPIQKNAIPVIMSGRDLMGCAQTGSGKTAAFLLPIIHKLMASQQSPVVDGVCASPNAIIISPTRELAIQTYDEARKFALNSIVKVVVTYGGTAVNHQRQQVLNGCHILVATPGRLNDFVNKGHVSFAEVQFVVLDEADRMLDTGFMPTVESMLGHPTMRATGERQTLMFSATFPKEIQDLAGKFLFNYIFIAVGIIGSASTDVEQVFYPVKRFDKRQKLIELIKNGEKDRTLVFVETKRSADFIAAFLCENDIKSTSIHGDRQQREREEALWDFKKGIRNILVATGVAARGLDIKNVHHVVNYDLPNSIDEYVHRIGRTGRVGNKGKATSFYDADHDRNLAGSLAQILRQANQTVPDFLSDEGGASSFGDDQFGGRDIRGSDFGQAQNFNKNPVEEAEAEW